jgi:hypothetical protein
LPQEPTAGRASIADIAELVEYLANRIEKLTEAEITSAVTKLEEMVAPYGTLDDPDHLVPALQRAATAEGSLDDFAQAQRAVGAALARVRLEFDRAPTRRELFALLRKLAPVCVILGLAGDIHSLVPEPPYPRPATAEVRPHHAEQQKQDDQPEQQNDADHMTSTEPALAGGQPATPPPLAEGLSRAAASVAQRWPWMTLKQILWHEFATVARMSEVEGLISAHLDLAPAGNTLSRGETRLLEWQADGSDPARFPLDSSDLMADKGRPPDESPQSYIRAVLRTAAEEVRSKDL